MASFVERTGKNGRKTWLVQVCVTTGGRRTIISRTSKSPRKTDARALARTLEAERDKGTLVTAKHTVGELLDDLVRDYQINGKSVDWCRGIVEWHLRPFFGRLAPEKVTTTLLQQFVAKRQEQEAANATCNRDLQMLRRAFNLGMKAGKVARVPFFPMLEVNNVRQGFFEYDEFRALLPHLPPHLQPVLIFGYHIGSRKGEILNLKWSQCDLNERIIRLEVGTTKNKRGRSIPLGAEVLAMLEMQKAIRDQYWPDCPWIFHRLGRRMHQFDKAWATACRKAGLWDAEAQKPTRIFHDLRRSAARNLIRAGNSEKVVQSITGHRTRACLDRYDIIAEQDLKVAAARLDTYLAGKAQETQEEKSPSKFNHGPETGPIQ